MKIKILVVLFICFTLMLGIGYGSLSTELNIGGDLLIKVNRSAEIYELKEVSSVNVVNKNISFEQFKINGNVEFNDYLTGNIIYLIRFRNNSDIDLVLKNIINNSSVNLNYEFTNIGIDSIIRRGEDISFELKLSSNSELLVNENFEFEFDFQEYIE